MDVLVGPETASGVLRLACDDCRLAPGCQLRGALEGVRFTLVPTDSAGRLACSAFILAAPSDMLPHPTPTARELEVLRAVVEHGSVPSAALALGVARSTARNTLSRLYKRIAVADRSQAVAWADDHEPDWRA
jgi:DNA-binding NarL/FixJ family response regulator